MKWRLTSALSSNLRATISPTTENRLFGYSSLYSFYGKQPHQSGASFLYNSLETPSASAFIQQRANLLPSAFPYLFHRFNRSFQHPNAFNDFRNIAVDCSDILFACDPDDIDSHLDNSSSKDYNSMHLPVLYDIHDSSYADAVLQNATKKDEFRAFCSMVDAFPPDSAPNTIFIADRGFSSYNVFAQEAQSHGINLVGAIVKEVEMDILWIILASRRDLKRLACLRTRERVAEESNSPEKGEAWRQCRC